MFGDCDIPRAVLDATWAMAAPLGDGRIDQASFARAAQLIAEIQRTLVVPLAASLEALSVRSSRRPSFGGDVFGNSTGSLILDDLDPREADGPNPPPGQATPPVSGNDGDGLFPLDTLTLDRSGEFGRRRGSRSMMAVADPRPDDLPAGVVPPPLSYLGRLSLSPRTGISSATSVGPAGSNPLREGGRDRGEYEIAGPAQAVATAANGVLVADRAGQLMFVPMAGGAGSSSQGGSRVSARPWTSPSVSMRSQFLRSSPRRGWSSLGSRSPAGRDLAGSGGSKARSPTPSSPTPRLQGRLNVCRRGVGVWRQAWAVLAPPVLHLYDSEASAGAGGSATTGGSDCYVLLTYTLDAYAGESLGQDVRGSDYCFGLAHNGRTVVLFDSLRAGAYAELMVFDFVVGFRWLIVVVVVVASDGVLPGRLLTCSFPLVNRSYGLDTGTISGLTPCHGRVSRRDGLA